MGFSLFGSSGDKKTNTTTTNVTNDTTTTTANSNNITTNTANTSNTVNTNNQSFIRNDSNIQNTALQLTDAFNRISNQNWGNVGNVNIGSPGGEFDYKEFFQNLPQAKMNQTQVDLSKPLLDFNSLSKISTDQLGALDKLAGTVQTGFADNTKAAGGISGSLVSSSNGSGWNPMTIIVIVLLAVIGLIFVRRS
jgi:hypothetical protein